MNKNPVWTFSCSMLPSRPVFAFPTLERKGISSNFLGKLQGCPRGWLFCLDQASLFLLIATEILSDTLSFKVQSDRLCPESLGNGPVGDLVI